MERTTDNFLVPEKTDPIDRSSTLKDRLKRIRLSLRAKITLPYLFLAIVLALGTAVIATRIVFDTVEERFINQLIESGKLASEWMVRKENSLLETIRLLSNAEGVAEAIRQGNAEQLRELTFGITVNQQEEAVEFLNAQGDHVLSMRHRQGGNLEEYEFIKWGDTDFLQWNFIANIISARVDGLGDKYSEFVKTDWGDYFYIAGPVYDEDGRFAGVVLVGVTLQSLVKQIREETLSQVTIYDFEGNIVSSTFGAPQSLDLLESSTVIDKQADSSLRRNLDKRRLVTVNNIDYDEILGPWEVRGDVDLGIVGVALPKTFLVTASNVTRFQVVLLFSVALFLVIIVGLNLSSAITRPILALVQASRQVAGGDLQVQVASESNDEISYLADSFNQMVADLYRSNNDLLNAYDSTLLGWSLALELRDKETEGHTKRVTEMTIRLAREFGIEGEELVNIRRGAILHDIGKMGIPDAILLKPGPLTEEEWVLMRKHPLYAYEFLKEIEYLRPALDIPYYHHERWDGTGYPCQLKGEEIPLAARLFAIVDVWDALRSDRPYRKVMPYNEVVQEIWDGSGSHFDPRVVEVFCKILARIDQEETIAS
jgi:HD-GYP domain-containing protein (c-di-GMP phosphodiesterase class II)